MKPSPFITTIAGRGDYGFSGDGRLATRAFFFYTGQIAVDAAGNLYVPDLNNCRVRRVDRAGIVSTVAGIQGQGGGHVGVDLSADIGDGGPATQATLQSRGVAVDRQGNLYIADTDHNCVRRVGRDGLIATVAGIPRVARGRPAGFGGDGGPAVKAILSRPSAVAVGPDGALYIADEGNERVRQVDAAGRIVTIAGNGRRGYAGNGGPAARACLASPNALAVDGRGDLYIADSGNNRIRRVDRRGVIATAAGSGSRGYGGDGGPAVSAPLSGPSGVAIDSAGHLFIADSNNGRIRRVSPQGIIATIAGIGEPGYTGDGGPAALAQLNGPGGLAIDAAGSLLVSDTLNHSVRRITGAAAPGLLAGRPFPSSAHAAFRGSAGPPATVRFASSTPAASRPVADPSGPDVVAACERHLAILRNALVSYRRDHGTLPDRLSRLYPRYVADPEVFHCPADPTHGIAGFPGCAPIHEDPHLPLSYLYEMSVDRMGRLGYVWLGPEVMGCDATPNASWRRVRTAQIEQFGSRVPVVRCYHHGSLALTVSVGGRIYRGSSNYEYDPESLETALDRMNRDLDAGQATFDHRWLLYKVNNYVSSFRVGRMRLPPDRAADLRNRLLRMADRLAERERDYRGPLRCDLVGAVGSMHAAAGDLGTALRYYERSVRMPGNHDNTDAMLSSAYREAGMPGRADEWDRWRMQPHPRSDRGLFARLWDTAGSLL